MCKLLRISLQGLPAGSPLAIGLSTVKYEKREKLDRLLFANRSNTSSIRALKLEKGNGMDGSSERLLVE
jgi:hypothetical protein